MAITVVDLTPSAWGLVASGPGNFDLQMRTRGTIKLREASSLPSGEPDDSAVYWVMSSGETKQSSLNSGENLYAWLGTANNNVKVSVDALVGPSIAEGENHLGQVGGHVARASASFVLPAGALVYASGQMIANHATPASVVPMTFNISRFASAGGMLRRARLRKTSTPLLDSRLHLYSASPTVDAASGDRLAYKTNKALNYVGYLDFLQANSPAIFNDGAAFNAVPAVGSEIIFTADTYYGLMEARSAYTRVAGETWDVSLELMQN